MTPEFIDRVERIMSNCGFAIQGSINWHDAKYQRFASKSHWNKKKHLFVIVLPGGVAFGDWREPTSWQTVWEKSYRDLEIDEKLARDAAKKKLQLEKEIRHSDAIYRMLLLLAHKSHKGRTCTDAKPDHPYIVQKKIIPLYAVQCRTMLIILLHDIKYNLKSFQFIKPNGFKRFKKDASPKNTMCWLAPVPLNHYEGDIYVCEGWATGCSIQEVRGAVTVCAMSSHNLMNISPLLRKQYPLSTIHICADNDNHTKQNTGLDAARIAQKNTPRSIIHYPIFKNDQKLTDFNDLFCTEGFEETERQLNIVRF